MKLILITCIFLSLAVTATTSMKISGVRTASQNILVVYFMGNEMNEVNIDDNNAWQLNGQQPQVIDKMVSPHWSGKELGYEHRVYLTMAAPLKHGENYLLQSPYGEKAFVFDEFKVLCESIKTNQSAYSALSTKRYANFAIWLGTGGGKEISGKLPEYKVVETATGETATHGIMEALGKNENSGDYVYRMDLSEVSEGGPYKIVVKGYGSSHPFGVGGAFSDRLAYVQFRGLLHQRCGMEQKQPYFDYDIREACHTLVHITNSPSGEAKVDFSGADSTMYVYGGYHDAGDADRRDHHMTAPIAMLTAFEAFPEYFTDRQFNIPDQFDQNYKPIGKENGVPDIIDEAAWGTLVFEYLQDKNGAFVQV